MYLIILLIIIIIICAVYYMQQKNNNPGEPFDKFTNTYVKIFNKAQPDQLLHISGTDKNVGNNVVLNADLNTDNQKWLVSHLHDDAYKLYSKASINQLLSPNDPNAVVGSNIGIQDDNQTPSQIWYIKNIDGAYKFINRESIGQALTAMTNNVKLQPLEDSDSQLWIAVLEI